MIVFLQVFKQLAVWIALVAAVFIVNYFSYKLRTRRYQAIEALANKGLPIPPDLLTTRQDRDRQRIRAGILLVCVGIAIAIFFWMAGGAEVDGAVIPTWLAAIAIFPVMMGAAQFIGVLFSKRLQS